MPAHPIGNEYRVDDVRLSFDYSILAFAKQALFDLSNHHTLDTFCGVYQQ
ncbi:hypothetical protein GCM10007891_07730 [Methylophaga thalassica]|uniref:Uncharacterized protein n=1 Tax=Methylophaga thalassica TaxID=40223 RepID=A0ABQ5TSI2_9GAMM|nr:hypothetical protein GCM10007891_07730 [Methylophaga thalassica]